MGKHIKTFTRYTLIKALDSTIAKQLVDKIYEKRKASALELEKYE